MTGPGVVAAASDMLRWLFSDQVNDFLADASIFFIFGGLASLAIIMFLVVIQRVMPEGSIDPKLPKDLMVERALRPTPFAFQATPPAHLREPDPVSYEQGLQDGWKAASGRLDESLRRMAERGIGEPRLLRHRPQHTRVRVYECGSCRPGRRGGPGGCAYEQGYLAGVFQRWLGQDLVVRETVCRLQGASACEFDLAR